MSSAYNPTDAELRQQALAHAVMNMPNEPDNSKAVVKKAKAFYKFLKRK